MASQEPHPSSVPYVYSTSCREQAEWIETVFEAKVDGEIYEDKEIKKVMHMALKLPTGHKIFMSDKGGFHKMAKIESKPDDSAETVGKDAPKTTTTPYSQTGIYVDTENIDEVYARAIVNKATVVLEIQNMFWGARWAEIVDPWGTLYLLSKSISTKKEEEPEKNTNGKRSKPSS